MSGSRQAVEVELDLLPPPAGATPTFVGTFSRCLEESPETTEARWDGFARNLHAAGLEPVEDEPFHTECNGKVVTDFYALRPIEDE